MTQTHEDLYGCVHETAKRMAPTQMETRDLIPHAPCRVCGRTVRFETDGFGELLALDPGTWRRHEHQGYV